MVLLQAHVRSVRPLAVSGSNIYFLFVLIGRAFVFVPAFVALRGHAVSAPSLPYALCVANSFADSYAKS